MFMSAHLQVEADEARMVLERLMSLSGTRESLSEEDKKALRKSSVKVDEVGLCMRLHAGSLFVQLQA